MYTDGLTDLTNDAGEQLGRAELLKMLRNAVMRHSAESLDSMIHDVGVALDRYREAQLPPDDRALLLCRRAVRGPGGM